MMMSFYVETRVFGIFPNRFVFDQYDAGEEISRVNVQQKDNTGSLYVREQCVKFALPLINLPKT
jgi:hypothetical protein